MRKAELERNTKETQIKLSLALDGKGESNLKADLPFFVHMIDQLSNCLLYTSPSPRDA